MPSNKLRTCMSLVRIIRPRTGALIARKLRGIVDYERAWAQQWVVVQASGVVWAQARRQRGNLLVVKVVPQHGTAGVARAACINVPWAVSAVARPKWPPGNMAWTLRSLSKD